MNIFIYGNDKQEKEIQSIEPSVELNLNFRNNFPDKNDYKTHDAFLILSDFSEKTDFTFFENKPVLINAVAETLSELKLPQNVGRINAWPGFLQSKIWEIVSNDSEKINYSFKDFNRKIFFVKDEPGFVSPRVISMIVNEAFFALGDKISTTEEIDMAMKLGTNYPYGPFEWAEKIGIEKIYLLLKKLSGKDERYLPAPAFKKVFEKQFKKDF